jgi:hypothetical protein
MKQSAVEKVFEKQIILISKASGSFGQAKRMVARGSRNGQQGGMAGKGSDTL